MSYADIDRRDEQHAEVFLLMVLGGTPAVITELVWYLRRIENARIAGLEIWTTSHGRQTLLKWLSSGVWESLEKAVGGLPSKDALMRSVRVFQDDNGYKLADICNAGDTRVVSKALHDAVQARGSALAESVTLIGSLAGGRKTMSAALQNAFMLQAQPGDRLVHVILDPAFEQALRESETLHTYAFPQPRLEQIERRGAGTNGASFRPEEQIQVHDIAVFPMRALLEAVQDDRLEVDDYLDGAESYEDVVKRLQLARPGAARGVLKHMMTSNWLTLTIDGQKIPTALGHTEAQVYRAVAKAAGAGITLSEIREQTGQPSDQSVRQAMTTLRNKLRATARKKGLTEFEDFHPSATRGERPARYRIPAAVDGRLQVGRRVT